MDNNDFLRRLRYALQIDDAEAARLTVLGGGVASRELAASWRHKEDDAQFRPIDNETVSAMLGGLISDRRGPQSLKPDAGNAQTSDDRDRRQSTSPWPDRNGMPPKSADTPAVSVRAHGKPEDTLSNNQILKSLRIALSMRAEDVHATLAVGGSSLSVGEVGALFRKPGSRNYRSCGDQVLRQFLVGLSKQRRA